LKIGFNKIPEALFKVRKSGQGAENTSRLCRAISYRWQKSKKKCIIDAMIKLMQIFFGFCLLLSLSLSGAKPPELSPQDAIETLHQMMEAHVSCKALNPTLVRRALEHYFDELDPTKTYLLKREVEPWLTLTEEKLEEICQAMEKGNFKHFAEIHAIITEAIPRRQKLEKFTQGNLLSDNISTSEFKELGWATSEEELSERLLKIKSLQVTAAKKLDPLSQEKALQRIVKNRAVREEELLDSHPKQRERLILSYVLKAFASSFDAHTAYFTPAEASHFMIQVQQRLFGIGAQLRDDLNGFTIVKIIEGGPASRNTGLKVNDRIIAINSEPVVGLEITEAVDLIRGEEGTSVSLAVLRSNGEGDEEKVEIEITRGEVVIKEARIESTTIPFGDGVIAHLALHAFYQDPQHSSSGDLSEEINKIQKEHSIKGIVLDLRFNAGGVLPQAVAVTGLFITKGIVCSIKDNHGAIEHLRDIDGKTAYDGPLIVLTSKASASASEIVAQTLQDYGRAIVVGDEHTYGKGTFQTFTLDGTNQGKVSPKGEFKVTRGKYYTVSGKSPQLVGVNPDILIPGFYSAAEIGEKHAKNPLENDSIPENFNDDLSDIPLIQRDQISWLYRFNLQTKIKTYTRHLSTLKKNSEIRLKQDLFYQKFLEDLREEEANTDRIELFARNDPQLNEAINVMKDLILLLK
jgi:carboxyl-terminal processing protease